MLSDELSLCSHVQLSPGVYRQISRSPLTSRLSVCPQLGTVPAAVDEEGKDINPHIPQYISAAPWYFGQTGPTLKHQRPQEEKQKEFSRLDEWYKRGVDTTRVATKFRKGACENCGAVTHKRKDCMERPRKTGAKYTGTYSLLRRE